MTTSSVRPEEPEVLEIRHYLANVPPRAKDPDEERIVSRIRHSGMSHGIKDTLAM